MKTHILGAGQFIEFILTRDKNMPVSRNSEIAASLAFCDGGSRISSSSGCLAAPSKVDNDITLLGPTLNAFHDLIPVSSYSKKLSMPMSSHINCEHSHNTICRLISSLIASHAISSVSFLISSSFGSLG